MHNLRVASHLRNWCPRGPCPRGLDDLDLCVCFSSASHPFNSTLQDMLISALTLALGAQVAHFLEADLQPWAAALAAALFAPTLAPAAAEAPTLASPSSASSESQAEEAPACSAEDLEDAWRRLDELVPLGDAADAVLRAWRLPLHLQLPLTPAAWHPALLQSRVAAGELVLSYTAAASSCNAMQTLPDVHSLTLRLRPSTRAGTLNDVALAHRLCSALASLRTLRTLKLEYCSESTSIELLTCAPELSRLSQLVHLDLRHCKIDDNAAAALEPGLGRLTSLTFLDLRNMDGGAAFRALVPALSWLPQLAHLDLGDNDLRDADVVALASPLSGLVSLTFLDLSSGDSDYNVRALSPVLSRLSHLAHLHLGRVSIYVDGAAELALALGCLPSLSFLGLSETYYEFSHIEALAPALGGLVSLTFLQLSDNYLHSRGARALAPALGRLLQLAHLDLSCNRLDHGSAAALAPALGRLTALTFLDLAMFRDDADLLAPALSRLSRLAHLNLNWVSLSDHTAVALASPLSHLTALTTLRLGCGHMRDSDVAALAPALARLSRLESLDLSSNHIGDGSIPHLKLALERLTSLREVDLAVTLFSDAGAAQLRAGCPPGVCFHH